jgi:hypothetical protein
MLIERPEKSLILWQCSGWIVILMSLITYYRSVFIQ